MAEEKPWVGVIMGSTSDWEVMQGACEALEDVLGVPVPITSLNGMDSLLSIVQMPKGVPVGTLALGKSGAINAGLLAAAIVGNEIPEVRERLEAFRAKRRDDVLGQELP